MKWSVRCMFFSLFDDNVSHYLYIPSSLPTKNRTFPVILTFLLGWIMTNMLDMNSSRVLKKILIYLSCLIPLKMRLSLYHTRHKSFLYCRMSIVLSKFTKTFKLWRNERIPCGISWKWSGSFVETFWKTRTIKRLIKSQK